MKKLKVYLIRHGKTEANEKHLYCGKTDISLSERGNETLEILYPEKTYSEINEFWEYNFGDFEMKSYDMLKENKEYIKWITDKDGQVLCPNGESKSQYKKRIKEAFNRFIDGCYKENMSEVVLVSHGGTIGTILEIFYDSSKSFYEYQPECGRGYEIILEKIDNNIKFEEINKI